MNFFPLQNYYAVHVSSKQCAEHFVATPHNKVVILCLHQNKFFMSSNPQLRGTKILASLTHVHLQLSLNSSVLIVSSCLHHSSKLQKPRSLETKVHPAATSPDEHIASLVNVIFYAELQPLSLPVAPDDVDDRGLVERIEIKIILLVVVVGILLLTVEAPSSSKREVVQSGQQPW